jgi:hypothetical protein
LVAGPFFCEFIFTGRDFAGAATADLWALLARANFILAFIFAFRSYTLASFYFVSIYFGAAGCSGKTFGFCARAWVLVLIGATVTLTGTAFLTGTALTAVFGLITVLSLR